MYSQSSFSAHLNKALDNVSLTNLKSVHATFNSLSHVMNEAVPLADDHFHKGLEAHSRIITGVLDRPVYGHSEMMGEWRGVSEYYQREESFDDGTGDIVGAEGVEGIYEGNNTYGGGNSQIDQDNSDVNLDAAVFKINNLTHQVHNDLGRLNGENSRTATTGDDAFQGNCVSDLVASLISNTDEAKRRIDDSIKKVSLPSPPRPSLSSPSRPPGQLPPQSSTQPPPPQKITEEKIGDIGNMLKNLVSGARDASNRIEEQMAKQNTSMESIEPRKSFEISQELFRESRDFSVAYSDDFESFEIDKSEVAATTGHNHNRNDNDQNDNRIVNVNGNDYDKNTSYEVEDNIPFPSVVDSPPRITIKKSKLKLIDNASSIDRRANIERR